MLRLGFSVIATAFTFLPNGVARET